MKNKNMKINCWKLEDGNEVPMPPTATLDGFEWNGRFRITVTDDDGSLGLPFLFAANDTAILTVEISEQKGTHTGNKKIKQILRCVPRSLDYEITCSRIRSHNGKEHVWSAWETMSSAGGIKVDWDASSCVDTFITAGIYNISGERLNVKDGLPIANSNPGHTIKARLVVLDSSISGTGDTDDKCITQILTLSNRTGGDGDVYIRTGRAHSTKVLAGGSGWEPWGKLQQNIEVGQVTSLDGYIDNGMYSGVYTDGTSFFQTFVMVVINNYAVADKTGNVRSVSQFKYALNVDSTFSCKTRTGHGSTGISWGEWVDLGAATTTDIQDNSITAQKLSTALQEQINQNTANATKAANGAYWTSGPNAVTLNINKNDGTVGWQTLPAATEEKAGVMTAEDKRKVVNGTLSLQYGRNLFIRDDAVVVGYITPNGYLNPAYTDWLTTENFVNVKPNTDYKRTSVVTVAFYDINKNFVKQVEFSTGETFTSPSNAFFAKFSVQDKWTSMVSEADKWEDTYIVGKYPEIGTTAETKFSLPELLGGEVAAYKIATLGDSITQRGQWQEIIEHNCGFGFFNNGLSGRAIQHFAFHRIDGTVSDYDRILTASDFTGVNAIVICGYANSLWNNIGSMDAEYITINAEDADADLDNYAIRIGQYGYISALRSVIEYIMSICPAIPIIISSQLPMSRPLEGWNGATTDVDFDRVYNGSNKTCKDFADATKEVAEYYHLPFVDLHSNGQVNIHNYTTYYDGDDTTHPNFRSYNSQTKKFPVSGMRMMASLIGDAIKKVI